MKAFRDCKYSFFISYAHEDDKATDGWITRFDEQLRTKLLNQLRRSDIHQLQGTHLSGKNGPVSGALDDVLLANVADSYAMVIVVHNRYVSSEWCLQELEYFHKTFSEAGLKDRLYIVAMSKAAMDKVEANPIWKKLTLPHQVWVPFFSAGAPNGPAPVITEHGVPSKVFLEQLDKLMEAMEASIVNNDRQARRAAPPATAPALPGATQASGRLLFGAASPEIAGAVQALAEQLRTRGVAVDLLDPKSVTSPFAEFDAADTLVLAFCNAGSYLSPHEYTDGGHLAVQRNAWLKKKKSTDGLVWLDLRDSTATTEPWCDHQGLVNEVEGKALGPEALLERFAPPPPAPAAAAASPAGPADSISIYIESPRGQDVDVWNRLGRRIRLRWNALMQKHPDPSIPRLNLQWQGLSLEGFTKGRLDDADGVVLLWGNKDEEALCAQVAKVSKSLSATTTPGVVAYLMPQQLQPDESPLQARLWNVLQFQNAKSMDIDIVPGEEDRLDEFLMMIRDHYKETRGSGAPS